MSEPDSAYSIWDFCQTGGPYWLEEGPQQAMISSLEEVLDWTHIWEFFTPKNNVTHLSQFE